MYRELLPSDAVRIRYDEDRVAARLNQALSLRAFEIGRYTKHIKAGRSFYTADDDLTPEALRRINNILRTFYKVRQSDRNLICSQTAKFLTEAPVPNIVRIDLKSFYSNIKQDLLLDKIAKDRILCPYTFRLLKQAIHPEFNSHEAGLPEGICLSATLSELYLRKWDQEILKASGCLYYSRFVDDILIFTCEDPQIVFRRVESILEGIALINHDKKYIYDSTCNQKADFSYLGYRFRALPGQKKVEIEIAPKKISRIKTKVVLSILQFGRDQNCGDLYSRLKYLTSNSLLYSHSRAAPIKSGIYYTYPLLTEQQAERQTRKLDRFLYKTIFSKNGRLGACLSTLNHRDRVCLTKNNFRAGYKNRKTLVYPLDQIEKITKPWRYA